MVVVPTTVVVNVVDVILSKSLLFLRTPYMYIVLVRLVKVKFFFHPPKVRNKKKKKR